MGAFFAPDGVLLPPTHEVFNGPEGVTKFFSGIFAAGWTGHHLELIEAQGDERGAFAAARWSAQGKDDKGELKPFGGFTTTIFEKQPDGGLKVKLLTFN
jgi:ketosteroid isomerase-like protein